MLEFFNSSCWKFCGTLLGCVSVLSIECLFRVVLPDVNVHVSMFFSFFMSGSVNSSFPCRNCFPGNDGVFSIPGGNST